MRSRIILQRRGLINSEVGYYYCRRAVGPLTQSFCEPASSGHLTASTRGYYDKVNERDDDSNPSSFFRSFGTRSPEATAVPKELQTSTVEAVSQAEVINRYFLAITTVMIGLGLVYLWNLVASSEGSGYQYGRPEGYGACGVPKRGERQ